MIVLSNVSKKLDNFLLDDISFEIPDGYICGLVGLNGAGKTSLIHILLGLYSVSSDSLKIDNMDYEHNEKEIHDNMGTVLVEELFKPKDTALKNGNFFGRFFSRYSEDDYLYFLKAFHIDAGQRFDKLSKGQKLKCQFAFALACRPKYLILDEPAASFDPDFQQLFSQCLRDFTADGEHTVILSTHITDELEHLADYLIYLEKGKDIFAGDIETFRDSYRIVAGERYKINLLKPELVVAIDERTHSTRALVEHRDRNQYDASLTVSIPSIEEFMYFRNLAVNY